MWYLNFVTCKPGMIGVDEGINDLLWLSFFFVVRVN